MNEDEASKGVLYLCKSELPQWEHLNRYTLNYPRKTNLQEILQFLSI